jgi:uncharacterized protein (TIRG00374 family)
MSRNSRRFLVLLLGILISVVALYLVLRWAGWEALLAALVRMDVRFLLLAVVVYLTSMLARAAAWQTILNYKYGFGRVLAALNEGYLLNNVLPWRMGEVGRAVLLGRRSGGSIFTVLSSILVERLFDLALALGLLFALLPLVAGIPNVPRTGTTIAVVLILIIAVLWILVRKPEWIESVVSRLPGGGRRWMPAWERVRQGLQALQDPRLLFKTLGWMALTWALAGVEYWLVMKALIPEAEWTWAFFMLTITLLGGAIPSSPGYFGVFEAAGVLALSVFDVPKAEALAVSLTIHGMVYSIGSLFGLIALLNEGGTISGLYQDIRRWLSTGSNHQAG